MAIRQLANLTILKIDFSKTGFSGDDLKDLANTLIDMRDLQDLEFKVARSKENPFDNQAVKEFSSGLNLLTSLNSLHLKFGLGAEVDHEGL